MQILKVRGEFGKNANLGSLSMHYNNWFKVLLNFLFFVLFCLFGMTTQGQTTHFLLGKTNLFVSASSGISSVVVGSPTTSNAWTAMVAGSWLHVAPEYQSGVGSTNVIFSFDANSGMTRSGTITFSNQTLAITQAASNYVRCTAPTLLVPSGMCYPLALAVDSSGDVYIADAPSNCVRKWTLTNNALSTAITGVSYPIDLAFDQTNNLYIGGGGVSRWNPTTKALYHYSSFSGGFSESGLAVDAVGNIYVTDGFPGGSITVYPPTYPQKPSTNYGGFYEPSGARVDVGGTIFVSGQTGAPGLTEVNPFSAATNILGSGMTSVGKLYAATLALDGGDNAFLAVQDGVAEWVAATQNFVLPVSTNVPVDGVAVDGAGNLYYSTGGGGTNGALWELPNAFVDPTLKLEGMAAGMDSLGSVLPGTINMLPPFAPKSSDPTWLKISGISNGIVTFAFTTNSGPARTAYINLFGQSIPVTQGLVGTPPTLGVTQVAFDDMLQFSFTNTPGASFTVLSATDLTQSISAWAIVGHVPEVSSGIFQFSSSVPTNPAQMFYTVRSP